MENTTAVTNSAKATRPGPEAAVSSGFATTTSSSAAPITTRIPKPETGLFEAPMSPAM